MFLLVPAYPGCPEQMAVKWLLLSCSSVSTFFTTFAFKIGFSQPEINIQQTKSNVKDLSDFMCAER